jgi:hypothetical protein
MDWCCFFDMAAMMRRSKKSSDLSRIEWCHRNSENCGSNSAKAAMSPDLVLRTEVGAADIEPAITRQLARSFI